MAVNVECTTCRDERLLILPTASGDTVEHPCPTCRPWGGGFGGLYARRGRVLICLIKPAAPRERAMLTTTEERNETHTPQ